MNFEDVSKLNSERKEQQKANRFIINDDEILTGFKTVSIDTLNDYHDIDGNQPFSIDDDKVSAISKSISENGQLEPIIVRTLDSDKYQILSGHHRKRAIIIAGLKTANVTIVDVNDFKAYCMVVESNIHHKGPRPSQLGQMFKRYKRYNTKDNGGDFTAEKIAEMFDLSKSQMYRYFALIDCIKPIQNLVDDGQISSNSIKDIREMPRLQQKAVADYVDFTGKKLSSKKFEAIKDLYIINSEFTKEDIENAIAEAEPQKENNDNYTSMMKMSKSQFAEFVFNNIESFRSIEDITSFLDDKFQKG